VIGMGNVAVDVVRILARTPAELERTDIADYALDALRTSGVRDIYMIGRRRRVVRRPPRDRRGGCGTRRCPPSGEAA